MQQLCRFELVRTVLQVLVGEMLALVDAHPHPHRLPAARADQPVEAVQAAQLGQALKPEPRQQVDLNMIGKLQGCEHSG